MPEDLLVSTSSVRVLLRLVYSSFAVLCLVDGIDLHGFLAARRLAVDVLRLRRVS